MKQNVGTKTKQKSFAYDSTNNFRQFGYNLFDNTCRQKFVTRSKFKSGIKHNVSNKLPTIVHVKIDNIFDSFEIDNIKK